MEIIINGIKTNYQVIGEGRPFLILHGWGSNSDRWLKIAEQISDKGFKVLILDLPGFGKSDPLQKPWNLNNYIEWFESFIKRLNLTEFYLLGHSFGGALAVKLAVKHPQEIKKLFLVSAAVVRKKSAKKNFFARISKIVRMFYFLPYYSFFRKAVYKFIIGKSDYLYVEGMMRETYLNVVSEDLSFHLPFIKIPTIIIWGSKDDITPIEQAHFIAKQINNSKLVVVEGAGHDLNRKQDPGGIPILTEKIIENL